MQTVRPEHLRGPEWNNWDAVFEPSDILFEDRATEGLPWQAVTVNGRTVMTIELRPHYCDRGRFKVLCELPDIDAADAFPRYYFQVVAMRVEIITFLNWRLWRRRVS